MRPVDSWSAEEREKLVLLERGIPVAMHMRRHDDVIAWAKQRGEVLGPCWRPSDSTRRARSAGAGEAAAPNGR